MSLLVTYPVPGAGGRPLIREQWLYNSPIRPELGVDNILRLMMSHFVKMEN